MITADSRPGVEHVEFYASKQLFGFGRRRYRTFEIFVADPERLLIDCVARDAVPVSALDELVATVDPDRAVEYAQRFDRKAVMKRVGYLLETQRGVHREELRVADRNYPVLDRTGPSTGEKNARWRLTVNANA